MDPLEQTDCGTLTVMPDGLEACVQMNLLFFNSVLKGIHVRRGVSLCKSNIYSKGMRVDTLRTFVYLATCLERRFYCAYFTDDTSDY